MMIWRMLTNMDVSVSTAREYLRLLMSIFFTSYLCQIILRKSLQMMQRMPCLSLIFGVSLTPGNALLIAIGTKKKRLRVPEKWFMKGNSWELERYLDEPQLWQFIFWLSLIKSKCLIQYDYDNTIIHIWVDVAGNCHIFGRTNEFSNCLFMKHKLFFFLF